MVCSDSEAPCPIFVDLDGASEYTLSSIKDKLEDSNNKKKVVALEHAILHLLNHEDVAPLLMTIIRFVLPSNHHRLKRLVHLFFQIFDFSAPDGTVREESILVCNALCNDLSSPNEYIRGSVLRLISKIRHWTIVQPMIGAILENLKHPEPYVHRNALLCLSKIAERFGTDCVMSAIEDTERLLLGDTSVDVKVQAFNMLRVCEPSLAVQYLLNVEGSLLSFHPRLHLEVLSSFFVLSSFNSQVRSVMMRIAMMLMENSQDNAVRVEGAQIVCRLKSTPVEARRAAASCLIKILLDEPDLNVKMLVLSMLNALYVRSSTLGDVPNVLENRVMDIVHSLNGWSRQVTLGILSLALRCLTRQNVEELLQSFKKAFIKADDIATYSPQQIAEYRILLIKAIHYTCGLYPERCGIVYDMLLGYLSHQHAQTAEDCALFFKQLTDILPQLREETIVKLLTFLELIPHSSVLSVCFWVIGEYAGQPQLSSHCCDTIYDMLAPFPFVTGVTTQPIVTSVEQVDIAATTTVVLQDGTYGAQLSEKRAEPAVTSTLREVLVEKCDSLLYCSIAQCMLKLAFISGNKDCIAKATHVVANLVQLMQNPDYVHIYSQRRLRSILKLCFGFLKDQEKFRPLLQEYINASKRKWTTQPLQTNFEFKGEVEDQISYSTIFGDLGEDEWSMEDDTEFGSIQLLGDCDIDKVLNTGASLHVVPTKELGKRDYTNYHQFTSLMDALYVEGTLSVVGTRMYLTLYLTNTSEGLLQNIRVELCANDRIEISAIPLITLAAGESGTIHANFKIKQSQNDVLYGHVYFDKKSGIQECLSFNPLSVCMYDYIQPSFISPVLFRSYWADFEWEHKIHIQPVDMKPMELLRSLLSVTHMTVVGLSPAPSMKSAPGAAGHAEFLAKYMKYLETLPELAPMMNEASFFAVNLFCRTLHEELALANLSVTRQSDGLYTGCFKIRSRTQGVALSLGERVTSLQRTFVI